MSGGPVYIRKSGWVSGDNFAVVGTDVPMPVTIVSGGGVVDTELPAAALAADNAALPTAPFVKALLYGYDGATLDMGRVSEGRQIEVSTRSNGIQTTDIVTRPADTAVYAAGDNISDSASAATSAGIYTLATMGAVNGGGGVILGANLIVSTVAATKLISDLWIFDTVLAAPGNDNAAFSPSDAEMQTLVAVLHFTVPEATALNVFYRADEAYVEYRCAAADTTLYGYLVARNAYTPANAETLFVRLLVARG